MKKFLISALLLMCFGQSEAQDLNTHISNFLKTYTLPGNRRVRKASLKSLSVNESKESITIVLGNGADEMYYTESIVNQLYSDLRSSLPDSLRSYKLSIIGDSRPIEYLIPTSDVSGRPEKRKIWKKDYNGVPWVTNLSRPYEIGKGLEGRHLGLCHSHGRYYDPSKGGWVWQRPRLFCTTEDLFSQTFVIPYLVPMLENAGAIVFTPRDRFWVNEELIIDNDHDDEQMGFYSELGLDDDWEESSERGFGHIQPVYHGHESPFGQGTCRQVRSSRPSRRNKEFSLIQWVPNIPKGGRYPVYVSYQSFKNSSEDVTYEIHHAGGVTNVSVNQKMGGGTWVYLGEYEFPAGISDCMITLSNVSKKKGNIVSADAVRIGGGMGNIERGGSLSGLPRWAEAAKYSAQWYGMPDSIYDAYNMSDEYRADIYSRPKSINELAGGSVYIPNRDGRNVPIEVSMAFHTDAGYSRSDELIGPLSICTTDWNNGEYDCGMDRYSSRDLASVMYAGVNRDMAKYGFSCRALWNRNYGESRAPEVPGIIFEMLSHQNFADMRLGYDPQFKFDLCRSFYKSILKYISSMHGESYVVQPLPVKDFRADLNESSRQVHLSWSAVSDPLEPSAEPTSYVVYTRKGRYGFDNGTVVKGTSCDLSISSDTIYSFQVCALNAGGKSFPSEILSAYISPESSDKILIVNGFTRLEGPAWKNTPTEQGFLLDEDPGVQYGKFAGFCGRQKVFSKTNMGSEESNGTGYSGNELEGQIIMGNTFDYPYIHGACIQSAGGHSFTSVSESAFQRMNDFSGYSAIDMIYGVQKNLNSGTIESLERYSRGGGKLIISGGNLLKSAVMSGRFGVHGPTADDSYSPSRGLLLGDRRFEIYRDMNPESYSVPNPDVVVPSDGGDVLVKYDNGSPAGVRTGNTYVLGFPIESIKEESVRMQLFKWMLNGILDMSASVEPLSDSDSSSVDSEVDSEDMSADPNSEPEISEEAVDAPSSVTDSEESEMEMSRDE